MFFIFKFHLFRIFNCLILKIMFKWSHPLTYMKFSLHQTYLMLLLLLSFYSHLHLQLSLAPLRIEWLPWQLVGHAPLNWSKVLSKWLMFTNHHVRGEVTKKRVNLGFGLGLEILVNYFFCGDSRVITWMKIAWKN